MCDVKKYILIAGVNGADKGGLKNETTIRNGKCGKTICNETQA